MREQPTTRSVAAKSISDSSSTFVRSIADFNRDFNLEATGTGITDVGGTLAGRRHPPEKAREKIFEILVQVARTLIEAPDVDQILSKVVDLLFDFLPAERAVVVLREDGGRLVATLSRQEGQAGPEAAETFSHTIVDTVVRERVAVLTSDALTDDRFKGPPSDSHPADPVGHVRSAVEPRERNRRPPRGHAAQDRARSPRTTLTS